MSIDLNSTKEHVSDPPSRNNLRVVATDEDRQQVFEFIKKDHDFNHAAPSIAMGLLYWKIPSKDRPTATLQMRYEYDDMRKNMLIPFAWFFAHLAALKKIREFGGTIEPLTGWQRASRWLRWGGGTFLVTLVSSATHLIPPLRSIGNILFQAIVGGT